MLMLMLMLLMIYYAMSFRHAAMPPCALQDDADAAMMLMPILCQDARCLCADALLLRQD